MSVNEIAEQNIQQNHFLEPGMDDKIELSLGGHVTDDSDEGSEVCFTHGS
jgi:hypothetical protein